MRKGVGSGAICLFMILSHSLLSSDTGHYPAGRPQIKFSFTLGPHAGPRLKAGGENIGYSSGFQRGPLTKSSVLCTHIYQMKIRSAEFCCVQTQLPLSFHFVLVCRLKKINFIKVFKHFGSVDRHHQPGPQTPDLVASRLQ